MKLLKKGKSTLGYWLFLDHALFKNNETKIKKIIEIINLFTVDNLNMVGSYTADEPSEFTTKLQESIKCSFDNILNKKYFLGKAKYSTIDVTFYEKKIHTLVSLIINYEIVFTLQFFNAGNLYLDITFNDIDGSSIILNNEVYNIDEIWSKVQNILKDKKPI